MLQRIVSRPIANPRPRLRTSKAPVGKRFFRRLEVERLEDRTVPAVGLGTAENFAVLGGQAVTNTGPSVIFGNVGVSPGSAVTGFPPGIVTGGTIHAADAVAAQAQSDLTTAYNQVAGLPVTRDLTSQDLGGLTLTAGVYFFSSSAQLTGTLTLDAQGNPNAEFDFQIGSTLTTASNSSVVVINGGDPCDVFWQVGSSATLGTTTTFVGHILALTSISLLTGASIDGSALARNGSVTLDDNVISIADCFTGSISGQKFNDLNGDGVRQAGEPVLSGLTVFLDTNNNGVLDNGETSTTTDANGNYTFPNLGPGTYLVREMLQPGIVQTTPNPAPITLTPGQPVINVDFGDFKLISIGGTKFQDTNGNGVQDAGEPGLQGITVFLDTNNNGRLDAGEVSTTTDAAGNYTFVNVGPGTFNVREVQQVGFTQTTANPGVIAASSGSNVSGVLFGNFQLISISGNKFQDTNGNGVRNAGEPGLQGITVFLDANNNGKLDAGELSTTTDVNGNYTFTNVGPGTYLVREVQQAGFTQTTANPAVIVASSGANVTGVLFGNFQLISISGNKFQDSNGNGIRNAGETGLQGVVIFLDTDNNGVLDAGERSTTTDRNGNFTFTNLGLGSYRVREVGQVGFVQMTNNPANIVVTTSGANVTGVSFGNIPVANLIPVGKILLTGRNMANLLNGTFGRQANFVANLYETFLGRAPDIAGIRHYLMLLQAGFSQAQVTAMFRADFRH
jgi:serine-aspartate repeat-containing protein C/D/E